MGLRTFLFVRDCFHFYLLELGCRCGGLFFVHVRVVFFLQLLDVGAEEFFYVMDFFVRSRFYIYLVELGRGCGGLSFVHVHLFFN